MKRQFSLLTILLLVFSYTIALAQNADAQVKEIVKSFRDHKNVEISFNYQYVTDANNRSEWQEGKAYLQGEAYKVIMKEQENSSDGTTIWCYLVDDEEVMVSNATEIAILTMVTSIFFDLTVSGSRSIFPIPFFFA